MKLNKIFHLLLAGMLLTACYKDEGNYEYAMPETPVVSNLNPSYNSYVGDSLIISPNVTISTGATLEYDWRIDIPKENRSLRFEGKSLRMIFGIGTEKYNARFTITNTENGMKYFHDFNIQGITDFNSGTAVLSLYNNTSELSFIKADGTVQAHLYKALNGADLPAGPKQLFLLRNANSGNSPLGYWIFTENGGFKLNSGTLKLERTLEENFFDAPETIAVGSARALREGTPVALVNGLLYHGTYFTWDQAPTYGMFGISAGSGYNLHPSFVINANSNYYIGFDKTKSQFLQFNVYGVPTYMGTIYQVTGDAFNPLNLGMEMIHMDQINGADCYAFCKASDGKIYELKFDVNFNGPFLFNTQHKREFINQSLITNATKWASTRNGVFYLTSGNKIYRYNPLNQDLRELTTDFGGKAVSMIKLIDDEQTLVAGVEGSIYYLDVNTGKFGDLIKKIDGIPGSPIDIAIR